MLNYSLHTYELFSNLSWDEFQNTYNLLELLNVSIEKKISKCAFNEKNNELEITEYIIRQLPFYGINSIRLHKVGTHHSIIKCLIYIVVNPCNAYLLQKSSGADIIESSQIVPAVAEINRQLSEFLPLHICKNLKPSRIDFCVNLHFPSQDQADEYIKLLRLGVPFKKLKEHTEYDHIQKRAVPYSDSLLLECASYSFEIYPKYKQMCSHSLQGKNNASGIVRIELRAKRSKLKTIAKKYEEQDIITANYVNSLEHISYISQNEIQHILRKMVGNGDFYPYEHVKNEIANSNFNERQINLMHLVCKYFSKKQKKTELLTKYGLSRNDWNLLLKNFNHLHCSPITTPKSFSRTHYPGIENWDTFLE